jgi:hypothetical protein
MTKFKIYTQDPVIGYDATTRKPVRRYRNYEKPFNWYKLFFWGVMIFIFLGLASCSSYEPLVDSRGKSSANLQGDMNRYHDDLSTCREIADNNTNEFINGSKVVYNKMRWRVLWLSPALYTKTDIINKCMEGRGYSVLNATK